MWPRICVPVNITGVPWENWSIIHASTYISTRPNLILSPLVYSWMLCLFPITDPICCVELSTMSQSILDINCLAPVHILMRHYYNEHNFANTWSFLDPFPTNVHVYVCARRPFQPSSLFPVVVASNTCLITRYNLIDKWSVVVTTKQTFYNSLPFALMVGGQIVGYLGLSFVHISKFCQPPQTWN